MGFEDFLIYHIAFKLSEDIFSISENFPDEEKETLVHQLRRSSQAVYTNIAEAYKKKSNKNQLINKLSDANTENIECRSWLRFATACMYISSVDYKELMIMSNEVEKILAGIIKNPKSFGPKTK
jgi:four helix bundle protein